MHTVHTRTDYEAENSMSPGKKLALAFLLPYPVVPALRDVDTCRLLRTHDVTPGTCSM
jgi:hypothetical protein